MKYRIDTKAKDEGSGLAVIKALGWDAIVEASDLSGLGDPFPDKVEQRLARHYILRDLPVKLETFYQVVAEDLAELVSDEETVVGMMEDLVAPKLSGLLFWLVARVAPELIKEIGE